MHQHETTEGGFLPLVALYSHANQVSIILKSKMHKNRQ